jgi:hypothetical protein
MPDFRLMHPLPAATGAALFVASVPISASAADLSTSPVTSATGSYLATSAEISPSATRARFEELAATWKRETINVSSISAIILHDAYQEIVGMGRPVLPLIFRELEHELRFWFPALRAITGTNPISQEIEGDVEGMRDVWLTWARENGYR